MEYSFEHLDNSQVKRFLKQLCVVINRPKQSHHVVSKPIVKSNLSKKPDLKQTKELIYHDPRVEDEFKTRIHFLEEALEKTKQERDNALEENKIQIRELNLALLSIRTRMSEFIKAKNEREKRVEYLEKRINKKLYKSDVSSH